MPELAQSDASEEAIEEALVQLIEQDNQPLLEQFTNIHQQLQVSASEKAADVVEPFL